MPRQEIGSDKIAAFIAGIGIPRLHMSPAMRTSSPVTLCVNELNQLKTAEPVMGAGGCVVPPPGYVKAVWEVCRSNDIAYISDEVPSASARFRQTKPLHATSCSFPHGAGRDRVRPPRAHVRQR
jgi:hypothetical protein